MNVEKISKTIGANIRADRLSIPATQEQYAALIGISQKSVQAYEVGRAAPPYEVLMVIADKARKTVDWFLKQHKDEK